MPRKKKQTADTVTVKRGRKNIIRTYPRKVFEERKDSLFAEGYQIIDETSPEMEEETIQESEHPEQDEGDSISTSQNSEK